MFEAYEPLHNYKEQRTVAHIRHLATAGADVHARHLHPVQKLPPKSMSVRICLLPFSHRPQLFCHSVQLFCHTCKNMYFRQLALPQCDIVLLCMMQTRRRSGPVVLMQFVEKLCKLHYERSTEGISKKPPFSTMVVPCKDTTNFVPQTPKDLQEFFRYNNNLVFIGRKKIR